MKHYLFFTIIFIGVLSRETYSHRSHRSLNFRPYSFDTLSPKDSNFITKSDINKPNDESEAKDALSTIVTMFQYYLDDNIFQSLLHLRFSAHDRDKNALVSKDEYNKIFLNEGVRQEDIDRLWQLLDKKEDDNLEFVEFEDLAELVYDEVLAMTTFVFMKGSSGHSPKDGITLKAFQESMALIFSQLENGCPLPKNEDLEFLFKQCDIDGDEKLNVKEFFYTLSIFLRFYRSGIDNNAYSSLLLQNNLFDLLWLKEKIIAEHEARLKLFRISFYKFFQMAVDEKILTQVANLIFSDVDKDDSGELNFDEFYQTLSIFSISEQEATLLYSLADTDDEGHVDFGEFLNIFETFVHRATAQFGFLYVQELGADIDVTATYTLFYRAIIYIGMSPLSDATFRDLFNAVDKDNRGTLDSDEFSKLSSGIISVLKSRVRDDINKQLEARSGLNATDDTIDELFHKKAEAPEAKNNTVAQSIVNQAASGVISVDTKGIQQIITEKQEGSIKIVDDAEVPKGEERSENEQISEDKNNIESVENAMFIQEEIRDSAQN